MNFSPDWLKQKLKSNPSLAISKEDQEYLDNCKENKLHNVITEVDGIKFRSQAEAERYGELIMLKMAGVIKDFERQPSFAIADGIKYTADFKVIYHDNTEEIEEVKGHWTEASKLRCKLFKQKFPNKKLFIIKNGERKEYKGGRITNGK